MRITEQAWRIPDNNPHTVLFPGIWSPGAQATQRIVLANAVPDILKAIVEEKVKLREIPWHRLEEIVAELLRGYGLEVWVTPRTHDGGRDVIARGELIPGEPALLAVEVKQKSVVGLADVQRALQANKDFPALLMATAGTFSGGVVREKSCPSNHLRLFLKDGLALGQWIDEYAKGIGWALSSTQRPISGRVRTKS